MSKFWKTSSSYVLDEKSLGLSTREEVLDWIRKNGKKLNEKEITSSTVVGAFIDHREFWLVVFVIGKRGYQRISKHLREAKKEDEKAHTKTKRIRGQLFLLADPDVIIDNVFEVKVY